MKLQGEHAETHRRKDQIVEDAIESIIADGPFTIAELCPKTETEPKDVRAVSRLCEGLRLLGWTKKRGRHPATRKVSYLWFRPDA